MIGKKIGIAIWFATVLTQAGAQGFGIELNGGLQGMYYPLKSGQTKLLPAGSFGLNYIFRLSNHFGLLTGVSGGLYRTQATLQDGHLFTFGEVDDAGSAFQYRLKFTVYKETQHFFAASIPLLLQYQTGGAGKQWYINGGGKFFIPFNISAQTSAQQVNLTGYYPDFNVEVSDLPQHGFGTLTNWNSSTTLKLKPAAVVSAGTGMIFRLSAGKTLSVGLFVDLGLTDLKDKNDSMPFVSYSSKGINGAEANSVLNSANAGQVKLHSYGLRVGFNFGAHQSKPGGQKKAAARPKTKDSVQHAAAPTQTAIPAPVVTPVPGATPTLTDAEAEILYSPVVFGILGETSIPEVQKSHLNEVVNILKKYPGIRLSVVGHYCSSETETEDRKVGEARAKAVGRYLQDKGISRNRIEVAAAIQSDPVRSGDPGANYHSRRVVIALGQ